MTDIRKAAEAAREAYARDYPMRTADMHRADCDCLRCAMDALTAALDADGWRPKRVDGGVWVSDREFWEDSDTPAPASGLVERLEAVAYGADEEDRRTIYKAANALVTQAAEIARLTASYNWLMDRYQALGAESREKIEKQAAEIRRLTAENFALAADQCHAGYAGDHGHHRCREVDKAKARAEQLERERDEAHTEILEARTQIGYDNRLIADSNATIAASEAREKVLREALKPFAEFANKYDAKPLRGMADNLYGIHIGTPYEAILRLTDCRRARAALTAKEG